MRKYLPILLASTTVFLFFFLLFNSAQPSNALNATHVVISEVQIEGATTTDEFVELYNPTTSDIDVTGWQLMRKTAATDAEEQLLATLSGSINTHSFLLIAHDGYDGTTSADIVYDTTFNITDNNTLILKDNNNQVIDMLGMGSATTKEGSTIDNPIDNRSVERKALTSSTTGSMAPGGADSLLGNSEDTDNNASDFVRHTSPTVSNPQNRSSDMEPEEISPTPTGEPTPTVTEEITPSVSPTVTVTSTLSPTISPTPSTKPVIAVPNLQIVCTDKIISFSIFGVKHDFNFPTCKVVRLS